MGLPKRKITNNLVNPVPLRKSLFAIRLLRMIRLGDNFIFKIAVK